jgi:dihydroorotase
MLATKKFLTAALIATSLVGGVSSATAADTKDAAIARAQAQASFQSQMTTYLTAHRAIVDAHRAANAKALADFQAALANVTTDAQLQAAKDARKAAHVAADATAKAAEAALVKPVKPAKPVKATPAPKASAAAKA